MISGSNEFLPLVLRDGLLLSTGVAEVHGVGSGRVSWKGGTAFGIVCAGEATLRHDEDVFRLRSGMYFVVPGAGDLEGGTGMVILRPAYRGLRHIGGPLEARGRLRYMDGCTDTLLVCPPRLGDPSLNHLHIPRDTRQSAHTHASDRIGVIAQGRGWCVTTAGRTALAAGMGWWIPAGSQHCFHTDADSLDVVAWHPDSMFGPTDETHPMILGTIGASVSAANCPGG